MTRLLLPPRRQIETSVLEFDGRSYIVSQGWGRDVAAMALARIGAAWEVFIQPEDKVGNALAAICADVGFLISQSRRHGAAMDRLRGGAQRDEFGRPETIAGAVLDLMASAAKGQDG